MMYLRVNGGVDSLDLHLKRLCSFHSIEELFTFPGKHAATCARSCILESDLWEIEEMILHIKHFEEESFFRFLRPGSDEAIPVTFALLQ